MKTIVVSAVNIRRGGTLRILQNCLQYLSELAQGGEYRIVAVVHKREVADFSGIEYIEMPGMIESWFKRLWCEYVTMHRISLHLAPVYLWLSLHDTTPRVKADRQAMYCQTSFPFLKLNIRDFLFNHRISLFGLFTKYVYRINVHRNRHIIVQAEWLKKGLSKMLDVEVSKFIVAPPEEPIVVYPERKVLTGVYRFVYIAIADCHKNIELICEAAKILEGQIGTGKFEVNLTIDGSENRYASWIYRKWRMVESVNFLGYMSREDVYQNYADADCLIFPSRVETWGLPISEFRQSGKPMLLADLPYARESSGGSDKVAFFDPDDAGMLASQMKSLVEGNDNIISPVPTVGHDGVSAYTWKELFNVLLS